MKNFYQIKLFFLALFIHLTFCTISFSQSASSDSLKELYPEKSGIEKINLLNRLSKTYWYVDPDSSLKYSKKALSYARKIDHQAGISDAYNRLGTAWYFKNEKDKALSYMKKSLDIRKTLDDPERITQVYNNLGVFYINSDTPEKALEYYQKALEISKKEDLPRKTGRYIMGIAGYYNAVNNYEKAIEHYLLSEDHYEKLKDTAHLGEANIRIGRIYRKTGSYDKALELCLKGLNYIKTTDNSDKLADAYNELGIINEHLGNYEKARKYYHRAGSIYKKQEQQGNLAMIYNNLGIIHHDLDSNKKALDFYQRSYKIDQKINDLGGMANSLNNMGLIYLETDNYKKSLDYLQQSLNYSEELNNQQQVANAHNNIGKVYLKTDQYGKAKENLSKALELATSTKALRYEEESYELFSQLYEALGEYKKALSYYKKHKQLEDTIFSKEKQNRISQIQVKYETEQKEKEIELLKKDNQINKLEIKRQKNLVKYVVIFSLLLLALAILAYNRYKLRKKHARTLEEKNQQLRQANERLRDSEYTQRELNATKDKFFSIIAHDLKNPFQALFGISEALYRNIDDLNKEEIKEYSKAIYESSNNLYNLLENLLQWSRTQLGNIKLNPQSIKVKKATDEIIELLRINFEEKGITVKNNIDEEITAFVDRNVYGTIVRNLISNSVKFTEKAGSIAIEAETKKDQTIISITDTGQGIPKDQLNNIFAVNAKHFSKGTSNEQGTGLGLILCKELVEKSKGKIWAESEMGKGSTFRFTLPNKENA
jgi:signal transduction histidine kinase/uncharacterized protein HemY